MGKSRDPKRKEAFTIYRESNGKIKIKEIASILNASEGTVRGWKSKDKWDKKLNGTEHERNAPNMELRNAPPEQKKPSTGIQVQEQIIKENKEQRQEEFEQFELDTIEQIMEFQGISERDKEIALRYLSCKNRTQAALEAGVPKSYAYVEGSKVLKKPEVKSFMRMLQRQMFEDLFTDAKEVLALFLKVAFSDMTNYASWGTKQVPVKDGRKFLKDADGNLIMKDVTYLNAINSDMVDGSLIQEISETRDGGLKIKLVDKTPAMQRVIDLMDVVGDREFKRTMMEKHLELEEYKAKEAKNTFDKKHGVAEAVKKRMEARKAMEAKK